MKRYKSKYTNFPYLNIDEYFEFPSYEEDCDGIVCVGGNLSPGMLLSAYLQGIFPWYEKEEPILWWSPDPRFVLFPEEFHIPKSLQKFIKKNTKLLLEGDKNAFSFSSDCAFEQVITHCSSVDRKDQDGTWINQDIIDAYCDLHELGFAHSYETWQNGKLVGAVTHVLVNDPKSGYGILSRICLKRRDKTESRGNHPTTFFSVL
jgi:leucyl/phenylalanyl-tRNA--protein transferase